MALYTKVNNTAIRVGDHIEMVTVYMDGEKSKKQKFDGVVIAIKNKNENQSFTLRKMTKSGIGVERIIPVTWPWLESITVKSNNFIRRAKLYYMRNLVGKNAMSTTTNKNKS